MNTLKLYKSCTRVQVRVPSTTHLVVDDAVISADVVIVFTVTFGTCQPVIVKQHSLQSVHTQKVAGLLLASSTSFLVSFIFSVVYQQIS